RRESIEGNMLFRFLDTRSEVGEEMPLEIVARLIGHERPKNNGAGSAKRQSFVGGGFQGLAATRHFQELGARHWAGMAPISEPNLGAIVGNVAPTRFGQLLDHNKFNFLYHLHGFL